MSITEAQIERAHPALISGLSFRTLYRALRAPDSELTAPEAASTIFRFFRSKHVVDFKLIVLAAVVLLGIYLVFVLIAGFDGFVLPSLRTTQQVGSGPRAVATSWALELFKFVVFYIGSPIGAVGFIFGWAYQSAAARLGVVDLFACEICTLCRVGTITDVGKRYVDQYDNPPPEKQGAHTAGSAPFVSQEDYFPILSTNARGLQLLEALVVSNITEFYTYMKATRDTQRRLAGIQPQTELDAWRVAASNVIYMLFLGYESARRAIEDLVEFEPTAAENKIVMLLTELQCYSFLIKHFEQDELRYSRLKLRKEVYQREVPEMYYKVKSQAGSHKDWIRATRTTRELAKRYNETFPEDVSRHLPIEWDSDVEHTKSVPGTSAA